MRFARNLKLSLRLLARDWRAGELRLFAIALAIAVGAVTAVGFFNDRVERGMTRRSAELLGADLVVQGPEPIARTWIERARTNGLAVTETVDFSSVVVRGERLQLTGVRAAGAGYPVRGVVRTASALYASDTAAADTPAVGTVWVEARLLPALAMAVGDRVDIGSATFTVTRLLTDEPGRGGNFLAFAPRALINIADVPRTGVIQPGSRVTYAIGLAGGEIAVDTYRRWLTPQLDPSQRVRDPLDSGAAIGRAIERVERYIGLTSLLAVLLAGVAIAMAARRYSARHYDMSAMLRCLGSSQRDIAQIYLPQLLVLGVGASLVGCAFGFVAQEAIYFVVKDLFPVKLPGAGLAPLLLGLSTGLITLAGFAVAPVLRLKRVPPLRVLRRELIPLPASAWAVYGSAAVAIVGLMWRYTGDWTLTLGVLGGASAAVIVLGALAWALLRFGRRWHRHVGVAWRFGLNNLWRRTRASVGQILAFGLTLMAMALIALVRTDLLSTWQAQLPAQTPNHFAFNILPDDVTGVEKFLATHQIRTQALYPVVRGRLTSINGNIVQQAVSKDESTDNALQRDLNLTWAATVPPDNRLISGAWWHGNVAGVSVEAKLAERLGIKLGDTLSFVIGGSALAARVTSLRTVEWDSFHPNFFMIFAPGVLNDFPATYMTSFYLPEKQKPALAALVRSFPAVTVLELDQFLNQVRSIVRQASLAIELVLLFVLAAGFAVLYATLATSLDERLYEGALLRTLGASRRQLRLGHIAEFTALGVLAGLLAAIGTEISAYFLYARAFGLEYSVKWPVWIAAPLLGGALIGVAGYVGTRRVVERSPLTVLREL
ncbi:MAG: FtsX-like permease family protein [Gammaproteobacteria bacterium]|nr:FtsX-like permease family protein [Gammaproteobacteria bacterium]